jgi:N-acetylglucosamine kinase-like BadF-type ATPase
MELPTYLISLEGGGTRSQAVLMDETGQVLASSQSTDVNTNFVPFTQAQKAVQAAVSAVLQQGGIQGEQISMLVSALVGPDFGAETFGELCPNTAYWYYDERDVIFARAGLYRPHGVAVVAATGATAWVVRQDNGKMAAYGGWGSLLGDEGSAYAMGLLALRAAVRAFEGRLSEPTALVDGICQHFDLTLETFHRGLIKLAYQKPLSRVEIAGIAPVVSRLAQQGDAAAVQITTKVSRDLAALGLHAARTHFDIGEVFDLVLAGGLLSAGERIIAPLREGLAQEFPQAVFRIGEESPAIALGRLGLYDIHNRREHAHRKVLSRFTGKNR